MVVVLAGVVVVVVVVLTATGVVVLDQLLHVRMYFGVACLEATYSAHASEVAGAATARAASIETAKKVFILIIGLLV